MCILNNDVVWNSIFNFSTLIFFASMLFLRFFVLCLNLLNSSVRFSTHAIWWKQINFFIKLDWIEIEILLVFFRSWWIFFGWIFVVGNLTVVFRTERAGFLNFQPGLFWHYINFHIKNGLWTDIKKHFSHDKFWVEMFSFRLLASVSYSFKRNLQQIADLLPP